MNTRNRRLGHRRHGLIGAGAGLLVLTLAGPALAVDGVIEINQAKAAVGGVTTGDAPGFPVSITQSGSYRLTSDLTVGASLGGISVAAENVTLDLNGFTIFGGGGAFFSDGIGVGQMNVEVRNGTVRGFSRHGIFTNASTHYVRVIGVRSISNALAGIELQGQANLVDGCTALNNGNSGIRALDGSLVINSVARGNTIFGLSLSATTGYRSNVLTGNNGGDANPQVGSGGLQLGSNVCGSDLVCP